MRQKIWTKFAFAALIGVLLSATVAWAADEDESVAEEGNREPAATVRARAIDPAAQSKARYRLFPGGQDEQDIQVQATLPQPQRSLEPTVKAPVSNSSSEE